MNASSEKLTTKASSWGFEASIRSSALLFTEGRLRYIEPELSTTRPMETGRSVCWKLSSVCFTPSSKTSKSSFVRFCNELGAVKHGGVEHHFFHVGVQQVAALRPASEPRPLAQLARWRASGERTGSVSWTSEGGGAGLGCSPGLRRNARRALEPASHGGSQKCGKNRVIAKAHSSRYEHRQSAEAVPVGDSPSLSLYATCRRGTDPWACSR